MKHQSPTYPKHEYALEGLWFYGHPVQRYEPNLRVVVDEGAEYLFLGSYSYLGLIGHPRINQAAQDAIAHYGTGTHGVRALSGTLEVHKQLEQKVAAFKQTEDAITFSSGYVANLSVIASLLGPKDTVIGDKYNHASIVDGCRLSGAQFMRFRHNDMGALEQCLQTSSPDGRRLVIVDAVFSMDGDIINLPEVSRLCREYGASLMVDEAHSIGVIGKTGHGIEEHFGLPPDCIDIKMGTFSKAIPSTGGYIAGSHSLCEFLSLSARGFIYSGALPAASAAAALVALEVIEDEPERVQRLHLNRDYFAGRLDAAGISYLNSETAIFPIVCGTMRDALELAQYCQQQGIYVQAILPPTVPEGTARLRASVNANHSRENLDFCLQTVRAGMDSLAIHRGVK